MPPYHLSLFCGRVANAGLALQQFAREVVACASEYPPSPKTIWAGVHSVIDVLDARAAGCDVVTLPPAIWVKLPLLGTDAEAYGLNTLRRFPADLIAAGY